MNKSLYSYKDYKEYLRSLIHSKDSARGLQSAMAKHLGCQSSYLYQILKGKGDLTDDQAFKMTSFLNFKKSERNYFLMSVSLARAATPELKEYLSEEIKKIVEDELELKNNSDAMVARESDAVWSYYFSGVYPSLIHILTSSDKFRTVESISKHLKISNNSVTDHLHKLNEYKFVNLKAGKWYHASPSIHFPKQSAHNLSLQTMRRSQALDSIFKGDPSAIHYSTLFSIDKKSMDELRMMISEFVEKTQKKIHAGGTEEVFAMCLDLFSPAP